MTPDLLSERAAASNLEIFGHCIADTEDGLSPGTLVLLGPKEPGFWGAFTNCDEWLDGQADPMDRWSTRVISALAKEVRGEPIFPFGPTLHPFMRWAIRSGRAWSSPVHLLVHDIAGLMVSYRGAILLPDTYWPDEVHQPSPCTTCDDKPCLTACPVSALNGESYDLEMCHAYLNTNSDGDCMNNGCAVRRSCPVAQSYGRVASQSSYHMHRFHK